MKVRDCRKSNTLLMCYTSQLARISPHRPRKPVVSRETLSVRELATQRAGFLGTPSLRDWAEVWSPHDSRWISGKWRFTENVEGRTVEELLSRRRSPQVNRGCTRHVGHGLGCWPCQLTDCGPTGRCHTEPHSIPRANLVRCETDLEDLEHWQKKTSYRDDTWTKARR